ncbi:MAG: efflux RND transporter periplasmic adaptor subunit [Burkholderiaceae bacterium]|nr:efflux RND transporter periplasmic adaptor subunit [Burkholderiaceae bacterium]
MDGESELEQHTTKEAPGARMHYVLGLLLILACIAAVPLYSWWHHGETPKSVPAKPAMTVTARSGKITHTVDAPGKLTLYRYVDVGSQMAGQVKEVAVPVGETVKAGRLLVEIKPPPDTAHVESNRAQLARLNADMADLTAQYEFAQLQFKRQTRLMADNATREETVESSRTAMLSSAAKLDAIRAQIQLVEANMKNDEEVRKQSKIEAPISGTIVSMTVHQGQMLNPGQNTLLRIADLSRMTVQARVSENDVPRLRRGMDASFVTPGLPGKRWTGKLNQIMPLPIDDSAQQGKLSYYTVLFDVPNPDRDLMTGMNANVEFILAESDNAVTLPACIMPDAASLDQTLTVQDASGKPVERKVVLGLRNAHAVQVVSGLQAGERVVVQNPPTNLACLHPENDTEYR